MNFDLTLTLLYMGIPQTSSADPKRITESKRGMWLEMLASPVITKETGL